MYYSVPVIHVLHVEVIFLEPIRKNIRVYRTEKIKFFKILVMWLKRLFPTLHNDFYYSIISVM